MRPVLLPPNVIDHFYRGGRLLAALRGLALPNGVRPEELTRPEEWIAATVGRAGEPAVGPSRLEDGTLFADLVAADRTGWTGFEATAPGCGPADTGLLVKLLDAGQRLPVHVHPTRDFARSRLHSCYGKTEAWYVLAVEGEDPAVWIGWREDVDRDELADRIDAQDSDWLLSRMNKITVRPGDGIVVPAGEPHATGAGVFVIEVQEPTDFSILLEWSVTTATREESHLDLGFEVALRAVDHDALPGPALARLHQHVGPVERADHLIPLLPAASEPFFRLDLLAPTDAAVPVDAGFAVLIVLDGAGQLGWAGDAIRLERGQAWAVPAGLGDWEVYGDVSAVVCRPAAGWPAV